MSSVCPKRRLRRGYALLLVVVGVLVPHRTCFPVGDPAVRWAFSYPAAHRPQAGQWRFGAPRVRTPRKLIVEVGASPAAGTDSASQIKLSSATQSTVNLVKNIVGAGMLSLPAGVAAFNGSPGALAPALSVTLLLGLLSAYGFVLIADACNRTGEPSYQGAWAKIVSPGTKWLPLTACVAKASIGCISFSMILGDCISLLLEAVSLPAVLCSHGVSIIGITATVLLPLCSMKSLAPLAKFSMLGVLSNVYICFFILLRCFDGSYRPGGIHFAGAPAAPAFRAAASGGAWAAAAGPGFSVLISILATAFLAHYNAPLYYEQLAPGPRGEKLGRFTVVSMIGFAAAGAIFSLVMAGGFMTFGVSSSGLILNNYAVGDHLAQLARVAICLSLITAYPLVFFSLRKLFLSVLGRRGDDLAATRPRAVTVGLLSGVTAIALSLHDLGKLAAFAGAVFGTFLIYVAPAIMALRAGQRGIGPRPRAGVRIATRALQVVMVLAGTFLGSEGVMQCLK